MSDPPGRVGELVTRWAAVGPRVESPSEGLRGKFWSLRRGMGVLSDVKRLKCEGTSFGYFGLGGPGSLSGDLSLTNLGQGRGETRNQKSSHYLVWKLESSSRTSIMISDSESWKFRRPLLKLSHLLYVGFRNR